MDAVLRYYETFNLIPVGEQNAISTPVLLEKLKERGCQISLRTLERDLVRISGAHGLFPLGSSENTKPTRWFWTEHLQFPMMSLDEALTFKLAEMFVDPVLPFSLRDRLAPYFKQADDRLVKGNLDHWASKFKIVLPESDSSPFPKMMASLSVISDALIRNFKFKATLHGMDADCLVNPFGMVLKLGDVYVVATVNNDTEIRKLPLYNFVSATLTDEPVIFPEGFDLNDYT